jgi:predicted acyltransferase
MAKADTLQPQTTTDMVTRVGAIDLLRALTMVLMIFVNDLWTLKDIPLWLEHVPSGVDGIGLADVVFPAFLFIVGMSLPFATDSRRAKGKSDVQLVGHIVWRTLALLVMGVFLVNGETINAQATGLNGTLWNVICCVGFILIWNLYPKSMPVWSQRVLKGLGVFILLILAFIYRGGDGVSLFAPQWWGILGLIGWSYLAAALVTVCAHGRLSLLVLAWVAFSLLSMAYAAHLVPRFLHTLPEPIIDGTMAGLSIGGVVVGTLFQKFQRRGDSGRMTLIFLAITIALAALSVAVRPFWGLSKLGATPAWLFLCSAFTVLAFTALYWLSDKASKGHWLEVIKPAGTDTLLCYLVPYFVYAVMANLDLPSVLVTGPVGLIKSLLFALLCVWIAGKLRLIGIRLKL